LASKAYDHAVETGKPADAVSAITTLGKLSGWRVERL